MSSPSRCLALLVVTTLLAAPLAGASPSTRRHRVIWVEDPSTMATIGWDQVSGEDPVLYFDTVDHGSNISEYSYFLPPRRREEYLGMDNCFAELTDLIPDREFYFVIADSEGVGETMWFRTAPVTPAPFTFIVGGDTKSYGTAHDIGRVGNRIVAKLRPLFVLYVGDFVSGSDKLEIEWQQWLDDWTADTRSRDGRIYPIVPVRGNHEVDPQILHRLFALPAPENYFAFDVAGELLRLYVLNSEIDVVPGGVPERADLSERMLVQTGWLEEDLTEHAGRRFKLAGYHKPVRPHTLWKAENDYLYPWAKLFHRHGVSLAFEGDSHVHAITWPVKPAETDEEGMGFVRDDETGTMYVGEGSWGALKRANDDDKPWTMVSASIQQFKWIQVRPDRIEIRTVTYDLETNLATIKSVDDAEPLEVPRGLPLFRHPEIGEVVTYPVPKK